MVTLTLTKVDRDCDLAVLKIEEKKPLPPIRWSSGANAMSPTLAGSQTVVGTMGLRSENFPPKRGYLRASFKEIKEGVIVDKAMKDETFAFDDSAPFGPQPLQKGDRLLSVEGKIIANLADIKVLFDVQNKPTAVAGDRLRLLVKRDSSQCELSLILRPPSWPIGSGQSARA